jgi:hypothetical protein
MFVWIATILRGIAFAFSEAPSFASIASSMGNAMVMPAARRKVRRLRGFNIRSPYGMMVQVLKIKPV